MSFFYKNIYSNVIQQKFSIPSNLLKSNITFEIKFEGIENLDDESVLKSFYFFVLIFGFTPSFNKFSSRYHLGKTFYNFALLLNFDFFSFDFFLINLFSIHVSEPNKISFISKILHNNLFLSLSDLKSFYLVESNPHFFKWEKDFFINCSSRKLDKKKNLNMFFFFIENFKSHRLSNFLGNYVS